MSGSPTKIAVADVEPNRRRGGDVRVLLSPRTVAATSGFGGVIRLEAGEFVSEHYHPYSEEFIYLVRGALVMRVGDDEIAMAPGDGLMVPIGVRHRVENRGDEPAEAVFHLGPLAPRPDLGHVDTEALPGPAGEAAPRIGAVQ